MRIGLLTGGGDCPGLNAVIRAVVRKGICDLRRRARSASTTAGGACSRTPAIRSRSSRRRGILPRGGTILGSSRTNPYKRDDGVELVRETFERRQLDGLIAIGGEDTLGVAKRLNDDGLHVIGVPKTIDNDLGATDVTFGFDTALHVASEAIDRLHTTAGVPQPDPDRRGDGPARRLDRAALRDRRRRGRDPDPGDPVRHRGGLRARSAAATSAAATSRSSSPPRAPCPPRARR